MVVFAGLNLTALSALGTAVPSASSAWLLVLGVLQAIVFTAIALVISVTELQNVKSKQRVTNLIIALDVAALGSVCSSAVLALR